MFCTARKSTIDCLPTFLPFKKRLKRVTVYIQGLKSGRTFFLKQLSWSENYNRLTDVEKVEILCQSLFMARKEKKNCSETLNVELFVYISLPLKLLLKTGVLNSWGSC